MRQLREVLRLSLSAGLSIRKISASTKISVGSIQQILKRAEQFQLSWPLPDDLDNQALALKFYPRADAKPARRHQEPDWFELHRELKKKGVTKQLLWEEYTQQFPNRCYSYSQFCARYEDWRGKQQRSMRQTHNAGEKLFLDYAGQTIHPHRLRSQRRNPPDPNLCGGLRRFQLYLRRSDLDPKLAGLVGQPCPSF
jgi:hypothetical protein